MNFVYRVATWGDNAERILANANETSVNEETERPRNFITLHEMELLMQNVFPYTYRSTSNLDINVIPVTDTMVHFREKYARGIFRDTFESECMTKYSPFKCNNLKKDQGPHQAAAKNSKNQYLKTLEKKDDIIKNEDPDCPSNQLCNKLFIHDNAAHTFLRYTLLQT